jgi:hypothetical protein
MAQRVNHNTASAVATTGLETAKIGLLGWLAAGVVGAVAIAAIAAVPVAAIGLIGGLIEGAALAGVTGALTSTVGAIVVGGAAAVGAIGGLASPVGPIAGGLIGLLRGGSRVKAENAAYDRRQEILQHGQQQTQNVVAQQAFAMGVQAGQQSVVEELQRVHAQMIQDEMGRRAKENPVGPHTAKLAQERAVAAQAPKMQAV